MSICPKGKHSSARRDKRKAQSWRIPKVNLVTCSRCNELMKPHHACRKCGTYNKRSVVAVD